MPNTVRKRASSLTGGALAPKRRAAPRRAPHCTSSAALHFDTLQRLTAVHAPPATAAAANAARNRYANVVADDASRVALRRACGGSDYVNASRVAARFVAAQAPLEHTVEHFWRMVCELRTRVVVCLTKFEFGRAACYFPAANRQLRYGSVVVATRGSVQYGRDLTVRFLLVQVDGAAAPHSVVHLYYSGWPDFGVPRSHTPLLRLYALMHTFDRKLAALDHADAPMDADVSDSGAAAAAASDEHPFVVHCSAGIGRAGTFIAAALLIDRLRDGSLFLEDQQQHRPVDDDSASDEQPCGCTADVFGALHCDTSLVDAVVAAMMQRPAGLQSARSTAAPEPSDMMSADLPAAASATASATASVTQTTMASSTLMSASGVGGIFSRLSMMSSTSTALAAPAQSATASASVASTAAKPMVAFRGNSSSLLSGASIFNANTYIPPRNDPATDEPELDSLSPKLLTSVFQTVFELRKRRRGMVQTVEQYTLVAKSVNAAARLISLAHESAAAAEKVAPLAESGRGEALSSNSAGDDVSLSLSSSASSSTFNAAL